MVKNYHNADNSITLDPDLNSNVFNTSQHRAMFYTTFRKVNLNGQQTNDGIDFVDWDPRGSIKHDGEIDINQVGLTSATTQYLKPDASLTNDPIADGLFYDNTQRKYVPVSAGITLSTTNLIIKT